MISAGSALLQIFRYSADALKGAGKEILSRAADETKTALIWLPTVTAVSAGLSFAGISAAPVIGLFSLGCTLYRVSQRPKTQIRDLVEAVRENKPYEVGQLVTKLALEARSGLRLTKSLKETLKGACQKGILDDTVKNVKKGIKAASQLTKYKLTESPARVEFKFDENGIW